MQDFTNEALGWIIALFTEIWSFTKARPEIIIPIIFAVIGGVVKIISSRRKRKIDNLNIDISINKHLKEQIECKAQELLTETNPEISLRDFVNKVKQDQCQFSKLEIRRSLRKGITDIIIIDYKAKTIKKNFMTAREVYKDMEGYFIFS